MSLHGLYPPLMKIRFAKNAKSILRSYYDAFVNQDNIDEKDILGRDFLQKCHTVDPSISLTC